MEYKDYYKILGVSKNTSLEDIKKAYKKLALKYHPDRNKGDKKSEDRFKEVNEAYEVLKDPNKRAKYDQLGSNWNKFQNFDGFKQYSNKNNFEFNNIFDLNLDDIFQNFFQGSFNKQRNFNSFASRSSNKNLDSEIELNISLKESFTGVNKLIKINNQNIKLNLKPGINNGHKLKLAGKGKTDKNSKGDLFISINIIEDPIFFRKNLDLYQKIEIIFTKMILGSTETITLIDGKKIKIKLPKYSQAGKTLKIDKMGFKDYNLEKFGDLYLQFYPKLPEKIDKDTEKKLKEIDLKLKYFR